MAKTVKYELEWHDPKEKPGSTEDCYVTIRYKDFSGKYRVWVQEGCYDDGRWGKYDPEYDDVDYFDHDYEVAAWAYKPSVQPCLDFVKED